MASKVCISGYFNPLGVQHLALIKSALRFGELYVIVCNDLQVTKKGSIPFQSCKERAEIVNSIKGVKETIISIDQDGGVASTLRNIRPDYYLNAGDRSPSNCHQGEIDACHEMDCMILYEYCPKIASSSESINRAIAYYLSNPKPFTIDGMLFTPNYDITKKVLP